MYPTINTWRRQERTALLSLYDQFDALIRSAAGTRKPILDTIGYLLKTHVAVGAEHSIMWSFKVGDDWIEVSADPEQIEFQTQRLARWRDEVGLEDADRELETDQHVMHMHLVKLYGDDLATLLKPGLPSRLAFGLLDEVLIDSLSLYALVRATNPDLVAAPQEAQVEHLSKLLARMRHRGEMVGAQFRGNEIIVNGNLGDVSMTEQYLSFTRHLPEAMAPAMLGLPLCAVIDFEGFSDLDLQIKSVRASSIKDDDDKTRVVLETNRLDDAFMIGLNPAAHLELEKS